ncbi:MAG: lycopene cyclase domain-containing protein [Candidatus Moranbacteria bacterium]|nr:lycopene cyclase domain-containing protein [Candidatus Moranbacteria bacterium]
MIYPIILAVYLLATFILHKVSKVKLWESEKEKRVVLIWFLLIFITGSVCDLFATSQQIWIFPGTGITGIRIFWLPIEEFFFFIIIPYFVLVLYKVLKNF